MRELYVCVRMLCVNELCDGGGGRGGEGGHVQNRKTRTPTQ